MSLCNGQEVIRLHSFVQLVYNEWLKLAKKRSFLLSFVIIAGLIVAVGILTSQYGGSSQPGPSEFATRLLSIDGFGIAYMMIALIFTAGVVSMEHQLGSVKLLLIRAHSRAKILASKYCVVLLYIAVLLAFTATVSISTSLLSFSESEPFAWLHLFKLMGYLLLYTSIYATMMFMFGVLTRSTGAVIGIGLFLMIFENVIAVLLSRFEFAKYVLFLNMNLAVYESGGAPIPGMTAGFSGMMIALYLLLFLAISFFVYSKRDIA